MANFELLLHPRLIRDALSSALKDAGFAVFLEPTQGDSETIAVIDFGDCKSLESVSAHQARGVKIAALTSKPDSREFEPLMICPAGPSWTLYASSARGNGCSPETWLWDGDRRRRHPALNIGPSASTSRLARRKYFPICARVTRTNSLPALGYCRSHREHSPEKRATQDQGREPNASGDLSASKSARTQRKPGQSQNRHGRLSRQRGVHFRKSQRCLPDAREVLGMGHPEARPAARPPQQRFFRSSYWSLRLLGRHRNRGSSAYRCGKAMVTVAGGVFQR